MAKLYKVRKKCMICSGIFYPRYAGSLYCETCKSKKTLQAPVQPVKKTVKKITKTAVKKTVKKASKLKTVKSKKPVKSKTKSSKR